MISRLFGLGLLVSILYIGAVFLFPKYADQYGRPDINAKIRSIKEASLMLSSGSNTPLSIVEQLKTKTVDYVSGATSTLNQVQNTLSGKVGQVKQAADSVENAYNAVNTAKKDLEKAFSLSGQSSQ